MNLKPYSVALPPETMVFPCETQQDIFCGWELTDVADATTWPGEPTEGWAYTYDAYLPDSYAYETADDGLWLPMLTGVYTAEKKGIPFTGSFRVLNSPKIARRYGKQIRPDEHGIRLFNPVPEDWRHSEFTHWVAVTPDEAVWILDKDMQRVLIKSLPYPIARSEDRVDWVRSGVSYSTAQAGESVVLKSTGETGKVECAYRDKFAMGFVVRLDVRGYCIHVPAWEVEQDAATQVQAALFETSLERQLAAL